MNKEKKGKFEKLAIIYTNCLLIFFLKILILGFFAILCVAKGLS